MVYFVEYQIPTVAGKEILTAGPYSFETVGYQLDDIKNYEGVTNTIIVEVEDGL